MQKYLQSSSIINWKHPKVFEKAKQLSENLTTEFDIAKSCFEYVRDEIKHCMDFPNDHVTCLASDVLKYQSGFCYAKSHLLAALLRANNIPTGLCYQRLTISENQPPYCLHGLNAVWLQDYGWYRMDARGNNQTVFAEFTPPNEKLAYPILTKGEADLPEIWPEPLSLVINTLETCASNVDVANNLPDIEII